MARYVMHQCRAISLWIMHPNQQGMNMAAFMRCLLGLVGGQKAVVLVYHVLQLHRRDSAAPDAIEPLLEVASQRRVCFRHRGPNRSACAG